MVQVFQSRLETAVHGPKCVRIEWISTPWIVFAVALVAYYCLTVIDRRQQDRKDEGDDRRETISNHDHDYRTMCFSESRCSQSLRTCCLHPRCMESSHAIGGTDRSDGFPRVAVSNEKRKVSVNARERRKWCVLGFVAVLRRFRVVTTFSVSHVRND